MIDTVTSFRREGDLGKFELERYSQELAWFCHLTTGALVSVSGHCKATGTGIYSKRVHDRARYRYDTKTKVARQSSVHGRRRETYARLGHLADSKGCAYDTRYCTELRDDSALSLGVNARWSKDSHSFLRPSWARHFVRTIRFDRSRATHTDF